jgi:hypothetical protein
VRKIALTALAALAIGSIEAQAADYGIGVSVQSDDSIIYAPIDFNDKFRLEPTLRYSKNELNGGDVELENLEVGIGLFGLSAVNKSIRLYYGGRLSYIDQETTQRITTFDPILQVTDSVLTVSTDADGYRISPTIGFEFMFNERLSIGGEAEYFFQDVEGDDFDTQNSGTDTRLILRFKF